MPNCFKEKFCSLIHQINAKCRNGVPLSLSAAILLPIVSRGSAKASACRLKVSLVSIVLCQIVSLQYLSRSSLVSPRVTGKTSKLLPHYFILSGYNSNICWASHLVFRISFTSFHCAHQVTDSLTIIIKTWLRHIEHVL